MIRISQLKLPISHKRKELEEKISKTLRLKGQAFSYEIVRQSLDAREKSDKKFVYTIDIQMQDEEKIVKKLKNKNIAIVHPKPYVFPTGGQEKLSSRPVIVGSGPAGIFCAWYLAKAGFRPLVLERGAMARKRKEQVETFWETGKLLPSSNVQFGEGGAGTFSDGKLNTLVKDPFGRNQQVLRRFYEAGAPEEILYVNKPHLGTDALITIVENLRKQIEEMGGEFRFESQVTDFVIEKGALRAVEVNGEERIPAEVAVLAIGHSARDTFETLQKRGFYMEAKAFAVGLRIEHPQKMINLALYGEEENKYLGASSYKLTHQCENGRGVYSFCMCPGGYVVNASSEEHRLAVNGMSYQNRGSENANSALIVTVTPEDFKEEGPLAGIAFQRELEEKAYQLADGKIPVQRFADYCAKKASASLGDVNPCLKGGYALTNVREILPCYIGDSIEEGIRAFGRKIKGFDHPDALLSGIESRTSSPVRIRRDEEHVSNYAGVYPCGEGAGYAGGITSAAMDGIKIAESIAKKYRM